VALLFTQWKSYANLQAFDTTNEDIAEALIWASLAAAAGTRFLAHATEHLLEVVIATHKAAMSRAYLFPSCFAPYAMAMDPGGVGPLKRSSAIWE